MEEFALVVYPDDGVDCSPQTYE